MAGVRGLWSADATRTKWVLASSGSPSTTICSRFKEPLVSTGMLLLRAINLVGPISICAEVVCHQWISCFCSNSFLISFREAVGVQYISPSAGWLDLLLVIISCFIAMSTSLMPMEAPFQALKAPLRAKLILPVPSTHGKFTLLLNFAVGGSLG